MRKLYNKEWVIAGLAVFAVLATFPFWYNHGKAAPAPEVELTEKDKQAKQCVRPTEYIRNNHMQLLDLWRDTVVREGIRIYENEEGKRFNMSLSNTCLDCHSNKEEFCDRCHEYASVDPYCYDCHIDKPKEKE
ncbi:MAG: sulfate reduction electron transfer complex DsrMKJOP subunit DsrJ [Thermodesulfobacteriota bacterium]